MPEEEKQPHLTALQITVSGKEHLQNEFLPLYSCAQRPAEEKTTPEATEGTTQNNTKATIKKIQ